MLQLHSTKQQTIWQAWLPEYLKELPEDLAKIDQILADKRFFKPFIERFNTRIGRRTVPVSTFLRLLYLRFKYNLGYETLVKEVSDSYHWRMFCQIDFDQKAPDSTTLIKLVGKYGEETLKEINKLIVKKASEEKIIRGKKMRADTTVVESNIHYPTQTSLLADGIRVVTREVEKIKKLGLASRTKFRKRIVKVKRLLFRLSTSARARTGRGRKRFKKTLKRVSQQMVKIATQTVNQAKKVVVNSQRALSAKERKTVNKAKRAIKKLKKFARLTNQLIEQTELVMAGQYSFPQKIFSLFDPQAIAITKGKPRKKTEFGRKLLLTETEKGIISSYEVLKDNTSDSKLAKRAVLNHTKVLTKKPKEVAFDKGFSSSKQEKKLYQMGVDHVCLPYRLKRSARRRHYENHTAWFKRLRRWRSGIEGRISHLKRSYQLGRSLSRGTLGTKTWVGYSIFAYNLNQVVKYG